jgi:hypothetical protein
MKDKNENYIIHWTHERGYKVSGRLSAMRSRYPLFAIGRHIFPSLQSAFSRQ